MSDTPRCPETRACSRCDEEKPCTAEYFHRDRSNPGGFKYACKVCCLDKLAERRDRQKAAGVCRKHPDRSAVSETLCQECLDEKAERYYRRKAAGVCPKHPDRSAVSETCCQECLDKQAAYAASPAGYLSTYRQNLKRKRQRAEEALAKLEQEKEELLECLTQSGP